MRRVVVIGAGAAGTMAAIFAASNGAETLLLERTKDGGRKILISGGGRCNILPATVHESRLVTDSSPHTLRKMLRSWPLGEQIAFFEREAGIPLMEEAGSAKLFPQSESARDVRDKLLALARARGVQIATGVLVTGLETVRRAGTPGPAATEWRISQQDGPPFLADAVVVATGGLSVPSTGSDGLGLSIVETLGHTINRTYPALTPLTATVRLKPDTTDTTVRLKPDTTDTTVRLKPDTTDTTVRLKPDTTDTTVRLKPDTTDTTVRLKPDTTDTTVRLKPDTTDTTVRLKPDTTDTTVRLKPDTTDTTVRLKPDTTDTTVRLKPDTTDTTVRLTPSVVSGFSRTGTTGAAPFSGLSGISLPVTLTARAGTLEATSTGGFLFTHTGYSGPAVLDVSHVAVRSLEEMGVPARLVVKWAPLNDKDWESALRPHGPRTALNAVAAHLPQRLAEALIEFAGVDLRRKLSQLTRDERRRLIDILVRGELPWSGDEGYRKAEVTGGGVRLSEIDPKTMESRVHRGLFLCGEMLDAFGPIGGYNFLWAWATGRAAGLGAATSSSSR